MKHKELVASLTQDIETGGDYFKSMCDQVEFHYIQKINNRSEAMIIKNEQFTFKTMLDVIASSSIGIADIQGNIVGESLTVEGVIEPVVENYFYRTEPLSTHLENLKQEEAELFYDEIDRFNTPKKLLNALICHLKGIRYVDTHNKHTKAIQSAKQNKSKMNEEMERHAEVLLIQIEQFFDKLISKYKIMPNLSTASPISHDLYMRELAPQLLEEKEDALELARLTHEGKIFRRIITLESQRHLYEMTGYTSESFHAGRHKYESQVNKIMRKYDGPEQ
jgi:hypothetical protein